MLKLNCFNPITLAGMSVLAVMSMSSVQAQDSEANLKNEMSDWVNLDQEGKKDWNYELGIGVIMGASYEGADSYRAMPILQASVDYKNGLFFASVFEGIGSYPIQGDNYRVGAAVGWEFPRNEDDDIDNLRGMGDIDLAVLGKLMGEFNVDFGQVSGEVLKGSSDYGTTAKVNFGTLLPVNEKMAVLASVSATWADDSHMQTYFGVSSAQSRESGNDEYEAAAGFKSVGTSLGGIYNVDESWYVMLMANVDKLIGDAADSPTTKNDIQSSVFISVNYRF